MKIKNDICTILLSGLDLYADTERISVNELCRWIFEDRFIFHSDAIEWIKANSTEILCILSEINNEKEYHFSYLSGVLDDIRYNPCRFFERIACFIAGKVLKDCECMRNIPLNEIDLTSELISNIKKEVALKHLYK